MREQRRPVDASMRAGARPRILLADDHQVILDQVTEHLAADFDIVAALRDGEAALGAVRALQPDAVVLDVSMPRMNGLEAAKRMAAMPAPPRIVFLTVHDDPAFITAAENVGAAGYVLKCNVCTQLVAALRRALDDA
jgi:DNA-binding NarL/FixJ family response regulator